MTTLRDLSRHLGLSVTQVSRALNNHDDVSEATKARVLEAARELKYQPNVLAQRLVSGRSGIVGLIYPEMPTPSEAWFFTLFVSGISAQFSRLGRQFMLHMPEDDGDQIDTYDRLIANRSVDGFIVTIPEVEDARVNLLRERQVPFVLHGQTMDEPDYPFFDIDNLAVGYELTKYLVDRGHRDIAFLNGPELASYAHRRHSGYLRALEEVGTAPKPGRHIGGPMTEDRGLVEAIRLFSSENSRPTAIIAGNTRLAKGIISALRALNLRIPEDVSIIAHDDLLPDADVLSIGAPLTVTEAPLANSWAPLAEFLDARLEGAKLEDVQRIGDHRLVERASVHAIVR